MKYKNFTPPRQSSYAARDKKASQRSKDIFKIVKQLYTSSENPFARWMWDNHVQWVAKKCNKLSVKYGGGQVYAYVGALLHDIADVWLDRHHPEFDKRCQQETRNILDDAGFLDMEVDEIWLNVIVPHSCRPGDPMPVSLEAKILATADGMAHLMTDFYPSFQLMGIPSKDEVEFKRWVNQKLDRDYNRKIFFEDEKMEVFNRYKFLKRKFSLGHNKRGYYKYEKQLERVLAKGK